MYEVLKSHNVVDERPLVGAAATWHRNGNKFNEKLSAILAINVLTTEDRAWYNARKNGNGNGN